MKTEIIHFSATDTTRALVKAISQGLNGVFTLMMKYRLSVFQSDILSRVQIPAHPERNTVTTHIESGVG